MTLFSKKTSSPLRGIAIGLAAALMGGLALMAPLAAADNTVLSADFANNTWEPLVVNGGPTLSIEVIDGDNALRISGRSQDYDGVATPSNTFAAGGTYTVSADVRLADPDATAAARLVSVPGYTWLGNSAVTGAEWTTLTSSWTVPADADSAAKIYVGTDPIAGVDSYDYFVDDI